MIDAVRAKDDSNDAIKGGDGPDKVLAAHGARFEKVRPPPPATSPRYIPSPPAILMGLKASSTSPARGCSRRSEQDLSERTILDRNSGVLAHDGLGDEWRELPFFILVLSIVAMNTISPGEYWS